MEYASVMWDPYHRCDIDTVENIRRAAAQFCKNDHRHNSSVTAMTKDLKWDSLVFRRKKARLYTAQDYTQHYPREEVYVPRTN